MIRHAQAQGFYPASERELRNTLEVLFSKTEEAGPYRAGVVPHAGYVYSGMASAALYRSLGKSKRLVVLGNDHYGNALDVSLHPYDGWETPLGVVPVDHGLEERLDALGLPTVESYREHSIEVQLPFLQHLWKEFTFVPITVPRAPASRLKELGLALSKLGVPVVATTDLSHYVPQAEAKERDSRIVDAIVSGTPDDLLDAARGGTMCGLHPVLALMHAFPGAERELVMHYTSGDVTGNITQVVGYASVGFL